MEKSEERWIWGTEPLKETILADEEALWRLRVAAQMEFQSDSPSAKDLTGLLQRYQDSSPAERDAINEAFVWFTGYTLLTLAERSLRAGAP